MQAKMPHKFFLYKSKNCATQVIDDHDPPSISGFTENTTCSFGTPNSMEVRNKAKKTVEFPEALIQSYLLK